MSGEEYKAKIFEMLDKLQNERFLKMIYGFVKEFFSMEKAGK